MPPAKPWFATGMKKGREDSQAVHRDVTMRTIWKGETTRKKQQRESKTKFSRRLTKMASISLRVKKEQ